MPDPVLSTLKPGATILVTGAAGFIGSHAAEYLVGQGYRVVGADNYSDFYDRRWKELNLQGLRGRVAVEEIDVADGPRMDRLIQTTRPTAILHLAAMAGVRPSIAHPAHYARVNVEGTTNLLESARRHGVGRFVFASSSSVYGNRSQVPFTESDTVDYPISPYAATKRAGELICYTFHHLYQLPIACLRFFTVYGPRQRPDLAIHKFTRLIDRGEPVPFFGDGRTSRDYTYVDDTVAGIMGALNRLSEPQYRIYNIGGSHPVTLSELVSAIERAVGKPAILDRRPPQPGDVERTFADISLAGGEIGYQPRVTLDEGLARFVAWYREVGQFYVLPDASAAQST